MARFQIDAFAPGVPRWLSVWKTSIGVLEASSGRAAIDAVVRDQTTAGLVALFDGEVGTLVAYHEDGRWASDRDLNVDEAGR